MQAHRFKKNYAISILKAGPLRFFDIKTLWHCHEKTNQCPQSG